MTSALRTKLSTESPQVIDWSSQLLPPGLYSLYFFDCSPGRRHSFDIDVHEYNSQPDWTLINVSHVFQMTRDGTRVGPGSIGCPCPGFLFLFFLCGAQINGLVRAHHRVPKIFRLNRMERASGSPSPVKRFPGPVPFAWLAARGGPCATGRGCTSPSATSPSPPCTGHGGP